jgi:hypothetical protein
MKITRSLLISLILMVVISALYRIMPNRPWGFAPQAAIGLFSGAVFVKNKKWAFALPLISLFLSDLLYEALYIYSNGSTLIKGFYDGQWVNYLLLAGITCFGFLINTRKIGNVAIAALSAPTAYFLVSNFLVWAAAGKGFGLGRPQTFNGLMLTYGDALPFYKNGLISTVVFSALLFGIYYLISDRYIKKQAA